MGLFQPGSGFLLEESTTIAKDTTDPPFEGAGEMFQNSSALPYQIRTFQNQLSDHKASILFESEMRKRCPDLMSLSEGSVFEIE